MSSRPIWIRRIRRVPRAVGTALGALKAVKSPELEAGMGLLAHFGPFCNLSAHLTVNTLRTGAPSNRRQELKEPVERRVRIQEPKQQGFPWRGS